MSKVLSWGKCSVTATPISGTGYNSTAPIIFDTIVEGSTSMEPSQGDKTEAKIEGGAVEAAKYGANGYTLSFQERIGSEDSLKLTNHNGVVNGEFKVTIVPENSAAKTVRINKASANVQLSYSSADGLIATYSFTALDNGDAEMVEVVTGGVSSASLDD